MATTTPKAPTFTIARNPKGARWHRVSGDAQACHHSGTKAPVLVGRVEVTEADLRNYARCARCFPVAKEAPKATPKAAAKAKAPKAPAKPKAAPAAKVRANVVEASNGTYECTCGCQSTGITRRQARRAHRAQQAA